MYMNDKLEKYFKGQLYKNYTGINYYLLTFDEDYIGSCGNTNINEKYIVSKLINNLVINMLIFRLIDEKELNLYDNISKYLDNINYEDIKLFHLLTHSSGLVNKISNKKFDAGSDVIVNDINYKVLTMIIEKLYNTNIELLARTLIFDPLSMLDTKLVKNQVKTTIVDLSHFVKMILNNGYYNGKQILDVKYIDLFFAQLFTNGDIRTTLGWIYGIGSNLCKNVPVTSNTIVFDNNHYIIIDRDNDIAIVCLFKNLKHDNRNNINKYIYKLLSEYEKI